MDATAERSIKAQLVSTSRCEAHWTIIFNESGECINADLSGNALPPLTFERALSTIEFRINDGCPSIDKLEKYIFPPDHFTKRRGSCNCMQWVWGVILQYTTLGCIEPCSKDGIEFDEILHELSERQSNALIDFHTGRSQVKDDAELGSWCGEDDNDEEARLTEAKYRQFDHQEAEEQKPLSG